MASNRTSPADPAFRDAGCLQRPSISKRKDKPISLKETAQPGSEEGSIRLEKVKTIQRSLAAGTYKVPSTEIAKALVRARSRSKVDPRYSA